MIQRLLRDWLLPRVVYLPWVIAFPWFALVAALVRIRYIGTKSTSKSFQSCIAIEAGERGWESIEFKEQYQSACEYVGTEWVIRLVVKPELDYVKQVAALLRANSITHYLYDPRTGSQQWGQALWQSFCVATLLLRYRVIPIVLLTDLAVRRWRAQAALVSVWQGLVITFMSARVVSPIFPHKRLLGPSLMPFSRQTGDMLTEFIRSRRPNRVPRAIFTGSLYEPRTSILGAIEEGVKAQGGSFECLGRIIGTARVTDQEYWLRLVNADIVFTTSVQMHQDGTDWTHIPHFLYRYLEVLASGSLLIAEDVPAVRRFFTPGIHFVSYENVEDGIDKIMKYLSDAELRNKISQEGKKQAQALLNARAFWMMIDGALGTESIT